MKKINLLIYIVIITKNLMNINNDKKEKILKCLNNKVDYEFRKISYMGSLTNEERDIIYIISILWYLIKKTKKEITTYSEATDLLDHQLEKERKVCIRSEENIKKT